MGTLMATTLDAPTKLADGLASRRHVARLVDQYNVHGVLLAFAVGSVYLRSAC